MDAVDLQVHLRVGQVVGKAVPFGVADAAQPNDRRGPNADEGDQGQQEENNGHSPDPGRQPEAMPESVLEFPRHYLMLLGPGGNEKKQKANAHRAVQATQQPQGEHGVGEHPQTECQAEQAALKPRGAVVEAQEAQDVPARRRRCPGRYQK